MKSNNDKDLLLDYIKNVYPLIDLKMNRKDCINWMEKKPRIDPAVFTYFIFHFINQLCSVHW